MLRQPLDLRADLGHVLIVERRPGADNGGIERLAEERIGTARSPQAGDRRAGEQPLGQCRIEIVVLDLPAAADDAARREVEPAEAAPQLDFLAVREPVALLPERALQRDGDVLELPV